MIKRKCKYLTFVVLIFTAGINQPSWAKNPPFELPWQAVQKLTNPEERRVIQAELDENSSCSGVPTKRKQIPSNKHLGGYENFITRDCNEAKVARFANDGNKQLLILQYAAGGSCGDYHYAFFLEDTAGSQINRISGKRFNDVCSGGIEQTGKTYEGDIFVVPGGIDEFANGQRMVGDLRLDWNGTELADISPPPHRR